MASASCGRLQEERQLVPPAMTGSGVSMRAYITRGLRQDFSQDPALLAGITRTEWKWVPHASVTEAALIRRIRFHIRQYNQLPGTVAFRRWEQQALAQMRARFQANTLFLDPARYEHSLISTRM
ncbi:hypothetical protein Poli38472_014590 [Pythium oligandrum]|uniref:Uncharacterized protein n=1 Tax=Pythium oligandrum TaxID=41045 RepID=A0A8K1FMT3_PYTOL|nr:hypothetical protein Poli38472_014590 [Pythium oligandrum]|eukprot:TMW66614.1 hypothetical protein Poli38472_014590 [Pythium oligandrum]